MTEPTDAEIIALMGDRQFSTIGAVREALRRWGTPPAVVGEPVAWLSTDCTGERYLCFTKPKDSNPDEICFYNLLDFGVRREEKQNGL